ncbi:DUF6438 domain-containing protein [Kaistella antarctica]|uniref:DUF6438 domain-containing protein n=1 Tax=Kaistella antarctica TaxID=266748 RepID=A0A3S4UPD3_9FLAO|nr:DUF6438 domain-containing protein [Kaistella antarctica]KEY20033.1 hypothetical protein HY04_02070 [Kaistella antarctica]SEV94524.1 hypothetical protein SAMN05421765_1355 [Kaistella antarctica]VEH95627.1 Uncharacterised protein [Kaistella antarctica]
MKYLLSLIAIMLLINCSTNKNAAKYDLIEYEAGACYGFCPIFKMKINSDRTAIFEAERFNFSQDRDSQEKEGIFKGTITEEQYNRLVSMLNSLEPKDLKDYYGNENVSDLPTSHLTLKFQDGTIKKIEDYGKHGTPNLEKVYQFFEDLKTNQAWTKIE